MPGLSTERLKPAARWLAALLFLVVWGAAVFDLAKHGETWTEFLAPQALGFGLFGVSLLSYRFPRFSMICFGAAAVSAIGYFAFQIGQHWRFFLENWVTTLLILYLPAMLAVWLAYQKRRPFNK